MMPSEALEHEQLRLRVAMSLLKFSLTMLQTPSGNEPQRMREALRAADEVLLVVNGQTDD